LAIKGISKERLTAKGYGETELIIQEAKNEEEHQVNRRTEFKVLEISQE
jgi:peptidoglycan-associated lipoprotein